jgi:hypothetical protein
MVLNARTSDEKEKKKKVGAKRFLHGCYEIPA